MGSLLVAFRGQRFDACRWVLCRRRVIPPKRFQVNAILCKVASAAFRDSPATKDCGGLCALYQRTYPSPDIIQLCCFSGDLCQRRLRSSAITAGVVTGEGHAIAALPRKFLGVTQHPSQNFSYSRGKEEAWGRPRFSRL